MTVSQCKACGATIYIAIVVLTDERVALVERVALEPQQEPIPPRGAKARYYRIIGVNPLRVERVKDTAVGQFHADHDFDCGAKVNH